MDILHHITSINNAIEKNKPLHQALEKKQLEILEEIESRETNKLRVQKELELRKKIFYNQWKLKNRLI